jgi:signal transduction histidine kinase
MTGQDARTFAWTDVLWLVFLGGLALLDPINEIHKQEILLAIGVFQIFEHRFLTWDPIHNQAYQGLVKRLSAAHLRFLIVPSSRRYYSVMVKIILATLLLQHTGGVNSSYYLIYFLPVVTAAMLFDGTGTVIWTALTSAAYCSLLIPAYKEFEVEKTDLTELAIRNIFFFLAAMVVNRFVGENRRQGERYRLLAEELAETNRRLELAQEDARRSERLAALGQLTAGLAHEIRNPLAVIRASAETLVRRLEASDPLTTEVAGYITSEVSRLNTVVTRFLNFARPLKLERRAAEIPPLLERALKVGRDRWPEARVEVVQQYGENLPPLSIDPDLCEQAFANLVLNAYEAMGEAGGQLTVRLARADGEGRRGVEISFEDTGPGVPPELHEQIFNPFFTTKKEGVGLGLSLVSKIVDDHRGWIRVSSEPGKGACFRVFLPAE